MIRRIEDVSANHFEWLVNARLANQRSTLALYKIIEAHEQTLSQNVRYQLLVQELAATAFSLWRSVFLSDLSGEFTSQFADVKVFLQNLIAHNTILYQTDFSNREWTFKYYVENAIYRLGRVARTSPSILQSRDIEMAAVYGKDDWSETQAALETAIANLAKAIRDYETN